MDESYNTNPAAFQVDPLDSAKVLQEIQNLAGANGWKREMVAGVSTEQDLLIYSRRGRMAGKRLYLSAGVHGNEPAGVVAVQELLKANAWPEEIEIWICPCLNQQGFLNNSRENEDGIDLNLDYRSPHARQTVLHVGWLDQSVNFDAAVCLHEVWDAKGFFFYEYNPAGRQSLARKIISRVAGVCPINRNPEIRGWPAENGAVCRQDEFTVCPQWSEGMYLAAKKAQLVYTLIAPSNNPLAMRVNALASGVRAVLDGLEEF